MPKNMRLDDNNPKNNIRNTRDATITGPTAYITDMANNNTRFPVQDVRNTVKHNDTTQRISSKNTVTLISASSGLQFGIFGQTEENQAQQLV